jgi:hypothetical protein
MACIPVQSLCRFCFGSFFSQQGQLGAAALASQWQKTVKLVAKATNINRALRRMDHVICILKSTFGQTASSGFGKGNKEI